MIRIVLFRMEAAGEWQEGIVHGFTDHYCVVETKATGEMQLVPVKPDCLKFKILTEQWVQMQIQAQRDAQARSVMAGPIPQDFRRPG